MSSQAKRTKKGKTLKAIARAEFRFADAVRQELIERLTLPAEAVDDLEDAAWRAQCWLAYGRSAPTAKERSRKLLKIQKSIKNLTDSLANMDPFVEREILFLDDYWKHSHALTNALSAVDAVLQKALQIKGHAGNKETDLALLAYLVADVLLKHGIEPRQYDNRTRGILVAVFASIGQDSESVDAAVRLAWKTSSETWSQFRPYSIQQLIEYRRLDPDWDKYEPSDFEEHNA